MTWENYIKARLIDLIRLEAAHHGGHAPMLAIAQVIANRVHAGWEGGDWMKVIENAPNYIGTVNRRTLVTSSRDPDFRELLRKIEDIYFETADSSNVNTEEGGISLYYAELHKIDRPWFKEQILSDPASHPRLAQVGQITFFG
jgi:hypothetical protein